MQRVHWEKLELSLRWCVQRCSFISVGCGIVAWGCSIDVLHQLYVCFYLETISNPWGYAWKAAASFTLEVVAENSVVWWSEWLYSILKCCCPQLRVARGGLTKNTVGIDILQNWNSKLFNFSSKCLTCINFPWHLYIHTKTISLILSNKFAYILYQKSSGKYK